MIGLQNRFTWAARICSCSAMSIAFADPKHSPAARRWATLVILILTWCNASCISGQTPANLRPLSDDLEGVWQDIQWGDLMTIRSEKGVPTVLAVIDSKTAEEFSVQSSSWFNNRLEFRYRIASNETNIVSTLESMDNDLIAGRWKLDDNTNSGEFRYRRILELPRLIAPGEPLKESKPQPIARVYRLQGNTVTITSPAMSRIKMHDRLYVLAGGKKLFLKVYFPMVTIARCRAENTSTLSLITEGSAVYK